LCEIFYWIDKLRLHSWFLMTSAQVWGIQTISVRAASHDIWDSPIFWRVEADHEIRKNAYIQNKADSLLLLASSMRWEATNKADVLWSTSQKGSRVLCTGEVLLLLLAEFAKESKKRLHLF
jgi:hypothetical protein